MELTIMNSNNSAFCQPHFSSLTKNQKCNFSPYMPKRVHKQTNNIFSAT